MSHRYARTCAAAAIVASLAMSTTAQKLPPVPVPPENPITTDKAVLGKILFWEEQISTSGRVACGTCHKPADAGADGFAARNPGADGLLNTTDDVFGSRGVRRSDGINHFKLDPIFGDAVQTTGRSAPSNIGAAFAPVLFWDGRATDTFVDPVTNQVEIATGGALESQCVGPPVNDVEMAHEARNWPQITARLQGADPLKLATNLPPDVQTALTRDPTYPALFARAFGDPAITAKRIAFALATYQRTLIPDQTPFDRFVGGNPSALTTTQRMGLVLYNGPAACATCHGAPTFTDQAFHALGVRAPSEDMGLAAITKNNADRGKFKTPTLRNAGLKKTFFHTGDHTTIEQVLQFYAAGGGHPDNKDPILASISIQPADIPALADFVRNGLTDPRVKNETFPFDRPKLWAETNPTGGNQIGTGSPGSGANTPTMLGDTPPALGNTDFRIGVSNALGGSGAFLFLSLGAASGTVGGIPYEIDPAKLFAIFPVVISGSGPGNGVATFPIPLPKNPALANLTVYAQWFIGDSSAIGGFAASPAATFTLF